MISPIAVAVNVGGLVEPLYFCSQDSPWPRWPIMTGDGFYIAAMVPWWLGDGFYDWFKVAGLSDIVLSFLLIVWKILGICLKTIIYLLLVSQLHCSSWIQISGEIPLYMLDEPCKNPPKKILEYIPSINKTRKISPNLWCFHGKIFGSLGLAILSQAARTRTSEDFLPGLPRFHWGKLVGKRETSAFFGW